MFCSSCNAVRHLRLQVRCDVSSSVVEITLISLTSGSLMTAQVRSKVICFTFHGCSMECVITSSKTHCIENKRQSVSFLVHMMLLEVTDNTRSGHRSGYQRSANEPNFSRVVQCMLYDQFISFPTQWCWL